MNPPKNRGALAKLADRFERLIDRIMTVDLDRRVKTITWVLVGALFLGIVSTAMILNHQIQVEAIPGSPTANFRLIDLLLKKGGR